MAATKSARLEMALQALRNLAEPVWHGDRFTDGSDPVSKQEYAASVLAEIESAAPSPAVRPETVTDALVRVREWAAAEPSGLMLRRDVVGTLDRCLALDPVRAAELADYRGRIARAVATLHQSSEYAISDALAGHLTRMLSDPPATRSEPSEPQDVPLPADESHGRGAALQETTSQEKDQGND